MPPPKSPRATHCLGRERERERQRERERERRARKRSTVRSACFCGAWLVWPQEQTCSMQESYTITLKLRRVSEVNQVVKEFWTFVPCSSSLRSLEALRALHTLHTRKGAHITPRRIDEREIRPAMLSKISMMAYPILLHQERHARYHQISIYILLGDTYRHFHHIFFWRRLAQIPRMPFANPVNTTTPWD